MLVTLERVVITRLGAAAATTALPFLPEIAIAVAALVVGAIVGALTKTLFQATADYLAQNDNPNIYDITISAGITEGVVVRNIRAAVDDDSMVVRNSGISGDLYGLSSGQKHEILAHCRDVLRLTGFADTLDVSEVDLHDYESWRIFDDEFTIDLAGGIDTVCYRICLVVFGGNCGEENGIFYYDGETHAAGGGDRACAGDAASAATGGRANRQPRFYTAEDILKLFNELHAEGQTVIIVAHDDGIAKLCNRRVELFDGKIQL